MFCEFLSTKFAMVEFFLSVVEFIFKILLFIFFVVKLNVTTFFTIRTSEGVVPKEETEEATAEEVTAEETTTTEA